MEEESLPLVSVVVPCYNHEKYVKETIESIINQTYKNIELIVIDDGSKDDSVQVIQELADKYGFTFIHRANKGLSATLNEGVSLSKGKYFSVCASDDIFMLDKIDILMNQFMRLDEEYGVITGNAEFIDNDSRNLPIKKRNIIYTTFIEYYLADRKDFTFNNDFGTYKTILESNYIPAMSTIIKKDLLVEVGCFNENIALEDWDIWLKLTKKTKIFFFNKIVARYRLHNTNSIKVLQKRLVEDETLILNHEKKYCDLHLLEKAWKESHYNNLLHYILIREYKSFFKLMSILEIPKFIVFLVKKIFLKLNAILKVKYAS